MCAQRSRAPPSARRRRSCKKDRRDWEGGFLKGKEEVTPRDREEQRTRRHRRESARSSKLGGQPDLEPTCTGGETHQFDVAVGDLGPLAPETQLPAASPPRSNRAPVCARADEPSVPGRGQGQGRREPGGGNASSIPRVVVLALLPVAPPDHVAVGRAGPGHLLLTAEAPPIGVRGLDPFRSRARDSAP